MPLKPMRDVFDHDRFKRDVMAYLERNNLLMSDIAYGSHLDRRTFTDFMQGRRVASLYIVIKLATFCDLSIDKYIKE